MWSSQFQTTGEMKLKGTFYFMVAIHSIITVGVVVYWKMNAKEIIRFSREGMKYQSSHEFQYVHKSELQEYTAQRSTEMPARKSFIYLTQTEQCLPPNLAKSAQIGDPETCNCDVIVLSYRAKCQEDKPPHISYLFDPNTLFASGRNVLYFAALDRRPGYHYYIFLDDDTILKYNSFTPANMSKMSPFRAVEKWLLDYEPAVGVLDYRHHGASVLLEIRRNFCRLNGTSLVYPTVFFDAIFNAFHHKAGKHILPYPTQYERRCIFASTRNAMITVEVKFGGQAFLFAPVTATNPGHRQKYKKCSQELTRILREYTEKIQQEAPSKLRNHVIFKMLHESPDFYLLREHSDLRSSKRKSRSVCVNVTRRQPIIPYRHLLNG